jgi:ABC-type phosphate transport system substrate-binding protein
MRLNNYGATVTRSAIAFMAAAGVFAAASNASAANALCSAPMAKDGSTALPGTVIVFTGSSAAKPMLKAASAVLAGLNPPIRLVYQSVGSCQGLSDVTTQTKETQTGTYWDEVQNSNGELPCDTTGVIPDVAISDVIATSCNNITVPNDQKEFNGSSQVFEFIVPPKSKADSISQEAAYIVYGWGGVTNTATPWTDVNYIYRRGSTSGTYTMLTKLIGLDITKLKGTCPDGAPCKAKTGDILTAVHNADATAPDKAIGIVSADVGDPNRGGANAIKQLAYQPKGAACGLYPDSAKGTLDKYNVRNGLYPFWGPLHFTTKVANGDPANPSVKTALSYFTRAGLTDPAANKTMIDAEVSASTIPLCAMHFTRTAEVAVNDTGLVPYTPTSGVCGCYYESKVGTASASCKTCTKDGDCSGGTPKCNYGYCEAQ